MTLPSSAGPHELLRQPAPRLELGRGRERSVVPSRGPGARQFEPPGATLLLGVGAGRLAYDLHRRRARTCWSRPTSTRCSCSPRSACYAGETARALRVPARAARRRQPRDPAQRCRRPRPAAGTAPGVRRRDAWRRSRRAHSTPSITPWLIDIVDEDLAAFAAPRERLAAARRSLGEHGLRCRSRATTRHAATRSRRCSRSSPRRASRWTEPARGRHPLPVLAGEPPRSRRNGRDLRRPSSARRSRAPARRARGARLARPHRTVPVPLLPAVRRAGSSSCACSPTWPRWWTGAARSATSREYSSHSA